MKNLSRILSELSNHGSWEGYGLLRLAIKEAVKAQPMPVSMDHLCKQLVGISGKQKPDTIYRSMARAVDDIWSRPDIRLLLKKYYYRELVEKPTLDSFICAIARYLWEEGSEPDLYEITFDSCSGKFGLISHTEDPDVWTAFPAITEDRAQINRIACYLCENQVPPEVFKNIYLSGELPDPA